MHNETAPAYAVALETRHTFSLHASRREVYQHLARLISPENEAVQMGISAGLASRGELHRIAHSMVRNSIGHFDVLVTDIPAGLLPVAR